MKIAVIVVYDDPNDARLMLCKKSIERQESLWRSYFFYCGVKQRYGDVLWCRLEAALRAIEDGADAICFVDSDVILPRKDWLMKMAEPLAHEDVIGTFTYHRLSPLLNAPSRYYILSQVRRAPRHVVKTLGSTLIKSEGIIEATSHISKLEDVAYAHDRKLCELIAKVTNKKFIYMEGLETIHLIAKSFKHYLHKELKHLRCYLSEGGDYGVLASLLNALPETVRGLIKDADPAWLIHIPVVLGKALYACLYR